jgi:hypothetical protein
VGTRSLESTSVHRRAVWRILVIAFKDKVLSLNIA